MPKLTQASRQVAQELLDWDIARVSAIAERGSDVSVYRDRQRRAQAALAADRKPEEWPRDVLDLFMTVLEVHGNPATPARQQGVGPVQHPIAVRSEAEMRLLKGLAKEIRVIDNLREVAPLQWGEDDDREVP